MNGMGHRKYIGRVALAVLGLGILVSGCMQTVEPASDANLTPRDRKLLANPPYARARIPEQYQRHIVEYPGRETPGTILIDSDARYLYYVLPGAQSDPLRCHRRRGSAGLVGRGESRPHGRMAVMDANPRD